MTNSTHHYSKTAITKRLHAWRQERETNKHGMQKYAERNIRLLEQQLRDLQERQP